MTPDDVMAVVLPYVRKAVEARVSPYIPFGRALATKDLTTHIRLALHAAIGRFGPPVVTFLDNHLPNPETTFSAEIARQIRGIHELCATPLSELDPVATAARTRSSVAAAAAGRIEA